MGIRAVTGYIAQVALVGYWAWVVASTAPQLRKGTRDRQVRARALLIKSAGFLLTAAVVGIIHYWATAWWFRSPPCWACCSTASTGARSRRRGTACRSP